MQYGKRFFSGVGASLIAVLASSPVFALSPPPPQADDELLPLLYETLGGEHWHNNAGWLDPDVHWCDWYGVDCGEEFWPGYYDLNGLELPDNNLSGEMTEELAELLFLNMAPESRIDLSGNGISGEMHFYPKWAPAVDLSGNAFSGPLPPFEGEWMLDGRRAPRLFLQRNDFSGAIPPSWSDLRLTVLDLSDNRLEGGHQHAIDAISPPGTGFVYLNGNPLAGELARDVLTAPVTLRDDSNVGGGIDICFTKLTVDDPDVRQWVADRHVASADFEQCLDRDRVEIEASISGSWYHPERSGEGISLMLLDTGAPLFYSFSFDTQGNQQWLFEVGAAGDQWTAWDASQETRGLFGEGIAQVDDYTFIRSVGRFRLDRVGRDTVSLHRHYYDWSACGPWEELIGTPYLCSLPLHADRMDYQRLTELAGTSCDNQEWLQQFSGAWYNPQRSGEGFVVEVLPDRRVVLYWFTYQPDDSKRQAWMIGNGDLIAGVATPIPPTPPTAHVDLDPIHQPVGASYGEAFDPADVTLKDWGSLRLEFFGDGGHVYFDSNFPEYGSGDYPIERLARPMLAECEAVSHQ